MKKLDHLLEEIDNYLYENSKKSFKNIFLVWSLLFFTYRYLTPHEDPFHEFIYACFSGLVTAAILQGLRFSFNIAAHYSLKKNLEIENQTLKPIEVSAKLSSGFYPRILKIILRLEIVEILELNSQGDHSKKYALSLLPLKGDLRLGRIIPGGPAPFFLPSDTVKFVSLKKAS